VRALIDAFVDLQCTIADLMFMKSSNIDRTREQAGGAPEVGSRLLQVRLRRPLNNIGIALLARITGRPETDPM